MERKLFCSRCNSRLTVVKVTPKRTNLLIAMRCIKCRTDAAIEVPDKFNDLGAFDQAINAVNGYKATVLQHIQKIEQKINSILTILEGGGSESEEILMPPEQLPTYSVYAPNNSPYMSATPGSCKHFSQNAEIAKENAFKQVEYVEILIGTLDKMKQDVEKYSSMSSAKTHFKQKTSLVKSEAQAVIVKMNKILSEINQFQENFLVCVQKNVEYIVN